MAVWIDFADNSINLDHVTRFHWRWDEQKAIIGADIYLVFQSEPLYLNAEQARQFASIGIGYKPPVR